MADKLQELTAKLYSEGLAKGKEEGERILEDARRKADEILSAANAEAAGIIESAQKQAADIKSKSASDIKSASEQCIQATKKDIENLLINGISASKTAGAVADPDFLKEIIRSVAANFNASESKDMALLLPENLKDNLEPWVSSELAKSLNAEIKADFSKKVAGGFSIGPKDGSWFISLTDDSLKKLIAEYLRPVTRKLLFGE